MNSLDIILSEKIEELYPKCIGLFFKVRENQYFDKKKGIINEKRTISLIKRQSCTCPACEYVLETLSDYIQDGYNFSGNGLKADKIYKMKYQIDNEEGLEYFKFIEV